MLFFFFFYPAQQTLVRFSKSAIKTKMCHLVMSFNFYLSDKVFDMLNSFGNPNLQRGGCFTTGSH